jgi:hypothetical protein
MSKNFGLGLATSALEYNGSAVQVGTLPTLTQAV